MRTRHRASAVADESIRQRPGAQAPLRPTPRHSARRQTDAGLRIPVGWDACGMRAGRPAWVAPDRAGLESPRDRWRVVHAGLGVKEWSHRDAVILVTRAGDACSRTRRERTHDFIVLVSPSAQQLSPSVWARLAMRSGSRVQHDSIAARTKSRTMHGRIQARPSVCPEPDVTAPQSPLGTGGSWHMQARQPVNVATCQMSVPTHKASDRKCTSVVPWA